MPRVLRFGISSLDELLGIPSDTSQKDMPFGIYLPPKTDRNSNEEGFATSVCLMGPTGTGKSIFGLHMASKYLADCRAANERLPSVLYVSTDLTYKMAERAWENFALRYPFARQDPFDSNHKKPTRTEEVLLKKVNPTSLTNDFDLLETERKNGNVIFVDMASYTAGDDWGFLHKLISLLPAPEDELRRSQRNKRNNDDPRHLIVVDAIEGFEALAGELNAFGQVSTRRSRIAQIMRLIAGKCHALLVVEEGTGSVKDEKLAEEFITDTVIRLDSLYTRSYERRVLKVEKVRGQSHIRGQHHYSIRSGKGSTTGSQVNPDDPEVPAHRPPANDPEKKQSYVQVFHSVHRLSRRVMEVKAKARDRLKRNTYHAAFGIKYLDNMLGGKDENAERKQDKDEFPGYYYDTRGLPCRSTTALIGDSLTQKSTLGKAFVGRCFHSFEPRLREVRRVLKKTTREKNAAAQIWKLLFKKVELLSDDPIDGRWNAKGKGLCARGSWKALASHAQRALGAKRMPFSPSPSLTREMISLFGIEHFITLLPEKSRPGVRKIVKSSLPPYEEHLVKFLPNQKLIRLLSKQKPTTSLGKAELKLNTLLDKARLTHLAAWLLGYQAGVAVMLVTHNTHHEQLAKEFVGWMHSKDELAELNRDDEIPGYEAALENHIKGGTICRRLEIHSLSSEVLIYMVQQLTRAAQEKILTREEMRSDETRYRLSWPIRIVIDDFSAFRDIFPELREDPLLLPSLLFHFEREGVTTLIVDTQAGKPDTPIAERFESELRKMVHHNLYTWRVPFYGESRVAITAIPPLSSDYAGIVRELRWESETFIHESPSEASEPATVDPHFELYTGLEEDNPQPVPLHVRFYAETAAMEKYIELENRFLGERFVFYHHPAATGAPCIIFGMPPHGYEDVRDLAYLQRNTRLEHTLLFQVDEFWAMRKPAQHKRAGAFLPQWPYLNAVTAQSAREEPESSEDFKPDSNADPFDLFQLREGDQLPLNRHSKKLKELRRWKFYENYYKDFDRHESLAGEKELLIDRIPFSWDFGFLLCQENSWKAGRHFTVKNAQNKDELHTVRQVWDTLTKAKSRPQKIKKKKKRGEKLAPLEHVSWRVFIQACKKAAEGQSDKRSKPVTAFDFAQISPESFSCLILEIWLSEIYQSLQRKVKEADPANRGKYNQEVAEFLRTVSIRQLFIPEESAKSAVVQGRAKLSLADLVDKYCLELYKSWLLLIEVLNFSDIIGDSTPLNFDFKSKNTDFSAIASRHWYKTASQCPDEIASRESLVPVRLPGHFSVRGDWFLAVSGGSRSLRQAERALDLLSSRRSNVTRLQMGIGLPTRVPLTNPDPEPAEDKSRLGMLRTKLISHEAGQDSVDYQTFLKIAAPHNKSLARIGKHDAFAWLWRSSFDDYAQCNRVWHNWLSRTLLWWHRKLLRYRSVWVNSFEVYDGLTNNPPDQGEFAPNPAELAVLEKRYRSAATDEAKKQILANYKEVHHLAQLKVRSGFVELWKVLKQELEQARKAGSPDDD